MTTKDAVEGLAAVAREVGRQKGEREVAWVANLKAKARLLEAIVEAVKPALPAIVDRVARSGAPSGPTTYFEWRAVALQLETQGRAYSRGLYLNEHAALVELVYDTDNGGKGGAWEAKWSPLTSQHAVSEYSLEKIAEHLAALLGAQLGGNSALTTAVLKVKAAQIEAVVVLLRGQKS